MQLHLVEDGDAWDAWASAWNRLLANSVTPVPFLRHEYLALWWQQWAVHEWGPQVRLQVVVAGEPSSARLEAAAAFFRRAEEAGRAVVRFVGTEALSDYADLVAPGERVAAFWRALATAPWLQDAALDLSHIPQSSPTLTEGAAALRDAGWRVHLEPMETCPRVELPATWEAYLQALPKKQRHELRRKLRRAENHRPAPRLLTVHTPGEVDTWGPRFLELMAHNPAKAAFLTPPTRAFFLALMRTAARHGWLHLAFLLVGEEPAAAYLAFDFGRRLWIYNSGLNPAWAHLSPGWVLAGWLIRRAIAHGYRVLDWLRGNETYKYRLGGRDFWLYRLRAVREA